MIIVTAVVKILKILVVTMLTIVIIKMTIKILTARIGDIVLALTLHT